MKQPVTVVVPLQNHRRWFFERFCLPSIMANEPFQVLIEEWEGGACEKRNAGAKKAQTPYIVFVDDDAVLSRNFLSTLVSILEANPDMGYAYSDFVGVVWPGTSVPGLTAGYSSVSFAGASMVFDPESLKARNFIDTTAVIRTPLFPGFDPAIRRFQDWDLWLTMLERGIHGRYVPGVHFMKFFVDQGISSSIPEAEATQAIRRKHRL